MYRPPIGLSKLFENVEAVQCII